MRSLLGKQFLVDININIMMQTTCRRVLSCGRWATINQRRISSSPRAWDAYRPATPSSTQGIEHENPEDNEYVLESGSYFYMKVVACVVLGTATGYAILRNFWSHTNEYGRSQIILPHLSLERESLDKSYSLYQQYADDGVLVSTQGQTHKALQKLLDQLVDIAASLGAPELSSIPWRVHILDQSTLNLTVLPGTYQTILWG